MLNRHGYTKTQAELAQVLRICDKNVSRYLLPVGHRHRISPRLDTIAGWCWFISQTTGLSLRIVVDSSAEVVIEASGYSAQGEPIEEESVLTSYREVDASPAKSWAEEWTKFLKRYKSFYTV